MHSFHTQRSDRRSTAQPDRPDRPAPTEIDGRLLLGSARRVRIHLDGRSYELVETGDGRLELSA